jgi:hypothetical protein
MNAKLLHPKAREPGLTVGVGTVPVTVGERKGVIVAKVGTMKINVGLCTIVVGKTIVFIAVGGKAVGRGDGGTRAV